MKQIMRFNLAVMPCVSIDADDKELIEELKFIRDMTSKLYYYALKEHETSLHEETITHTDMHTGNTIVCKMTDIPLSIFGDPNQSSLQRLKCSLSMFKDPIYPYINKSITTIMKEEEAN